MFLLLTKLLLKKRLIMKTVVKATGRVVEVVPYYLYGRIVAYVGDNAIEVDGKVINFGGKYAYLPDEIEFTID